MTSAAAWALHAARLIPEFVFELFGTIRHNVISRIPTWDPEKDIPDLNGRVVIVTGGNTGLGRVSVESFVKGGATVYMASRSRDKAIEAIDAIKSKCPQAKLYFLQLDLTSLASVKKAAEEFLSKETQLHILLNNAGIMAVPLELTSDGIDIQWQTNYISPFFFTKLLLPTMLSTAENSPAGTVRIVNISSEAHRWLRDINYEDTTCSNAIFPQWERYGQSKVANILHTKALAKQYGDTVLCVAVHPGVVFTELYAPSANQSFVIQWFMRSSYPYLLKPEDGALTQIWAATSPEVTLKDNGKYYRPFMKETVPSPIVARKEEIEKLWNYTENLLTEKGY